MLILVLILIVLFYKYVIKWILVHLDHIVSIICHLMMSFIESKLEGR